MILFQCLHIDSLLCIAHKPPLPPFITKMFSNILPRNKLTGLILLFDVETTGLPPNRKPVTAESDVTNWPYITQLSAVLYDTEQHTIVQHLNYFVKLPTGVEIPEVVTRITGIDNATCNEYGRPIIDVLQSFYELYSICDGIVAHNYDFDSNMIKAEIIRNRDILPYYCGSMFFETKDKNLLCTMLDNVAKCKIWCFNPKNNSRYIKFPKLAEVYQTIFMVDPNQYGLHNSMVDTLVCLRIFLFTEYDKVIPETKFLEVLAMYATPLMQMKHTISSRTRAMLQKDCVVLESAMCLE